MEVDGGGGGVNCCVVKVDKMMQLAVGRQLV